MGINLHGVMSKATVVLEKISSSKPVRVIRKNALANQEEKAEDIFDIKLSDLSDDPDFKELVKMFGLDNRDQLVKFLIEHQLAQFDSIREGLQEIREDLLKSQISAILNAKDELELSEMTSDASSKNECYNSAWKESKKAVKDLCGKLDDYTVFIRNVDNRDGWTFMMRSLIDYGKVQHTNKMAKYAVKAIIQGYIIMLVSALYSGHDDWVRFCCKCVDEFKDKLLQADVFDLMQAYDEKGSDFWSTLPDKFDIFMSNLKYLNKCLTTTNKAAPADTDGDDFDYYNVTF